MKCPKRSIILRKRRQMGTLPLFAPNSLASLPGRLRAVGKFRNARNAGRSNPDAGYSAESRQVNCSIQFCRRRLSSGCGITMRNACRLTRRHSMPHGHARDGSERARTATPRIVQPQSRSCATRNCPEGAVACQLQASKRLSHCSRPLGQNSHQHARRWASPIHARKWQPYQRRLPTASLRARRSPSAVTCAG